MAHFAPPLASHILNLLLDLSVWPNSHSSMSLPASSPRRTVLPSARRPLPTPSLPPPASFLHPPSLYSSPLWPGCWPMSRATTRLPDGLAPRPSPIPWLHRMPGVLAVLHVHLSPRPDLSAPPASGVLLEHLVPVGTPARLSGLVPSNPASHIITLAPRGSCAAIVAPTSLIGSLVLSNSTLLCGLWVVLAAPTHSDSLEPVN